MQTTWHFVEILRPHVDFILPIGGAYLCPVGNIWSFFGILYVGPILKRHLRVDIMHWVQIVQNVWLQRDRYHSPTHQPKYSRTEAFTITHLPNPNTRLILPQEKSLNQVSIDGLSCQQLFSNSFDSYGKIPATLGIFQLVCFFISSCSLSVCASRSFQAWISDISKNVLIKICYMFLL